MPVSILEREASLILGGTVAGLVWKLSPWEKGRGNEEVGKRLMLFLGNSSQMKMGEKCPVELSAHAYQKAVTARMQKKATYEWNLRLNPGRWSGVIIPKRGSCKNLSEETPGKETNDGTLCGKEEPLPGVWTFFLPRGDTFTSPGFCGNALLWEPIGFIRPILEGDEYPNGLLSIPFRE